MRSFRSLTSLPSLRPLVARPRCVTPWAPTTTPVTDLSAPVAIGCAGEVGGSGLRLGQHGGQCGFPISVELAVRRARREQRGPGRPAQRHLEIAWCVLQRNRFVRPRCMGVVVACRKRHMVQYHRCTADSRRPNSRAPGPAQRALVDGRGSPESLPPARIAINLRWLSADTALPVRRRYRAVKPAVLTRAGLKGPPCSSR